MFTLQDAIAAEVSAALALTTRPVTARHRSPCDGKNVEAYRAYLAGRYIMDRLSADRLPDAFAALRRAIALDPTCARAYAGLARLHVAQALTANADPREMFPPARAAVAQALALDPRLAEAHVAKGRIEVWFDWNWRSGDASFRQAVALDAASADAHLAYALSRRTLGHEKEAVAHVRRASELDPLSPAINAEQAAYLRETDPEAAHLRLASVLEMEPGYWEALLQRAAVAAQEGRPREGIADLEQAVEGSGGNSQAVAFLAKAYVDVGERERAKVLLRELEARRRRSYVPASALARIHASLGDTNAALDWLDRPMRSATAHGLFHGRGRLQGSARSPAFPGARAARAGRSGLAARSLIATP